MPILRAHPAGLETHDEWDEAAAHDVEEYVLERSCIRPDVYDDEHLGGLSSNSVYISTEEDSPIIHSTALQTLQAATRFALLVYVVRTSSSKTL